jgi:hypothetical protein
MLIQHSHVVLALRSFKLLSVVTNLLAVMMATVQRYIGRSSNNLQACMETTQCGLVPRQWRLGHCTTIPNMSSRDNLDKVNISVSAQSTAIPVRRWQQQGEGVQQLETRTLFHLVLIKLDQHQACLKTQGGPSRGQYRPHPVRPSNMHGARSLQTRCVALLRFQNSAE